MRPASAEKGQVTAPVYMNCRATLQTSLEMRGSTRKMQTCALSCSSHCVGRPSSSASSTGLCAPATTRWARKRARSLPSPWPSSGPTSKATSAKGTRPEGSWLSSAARARCSGTRSPGALPGSMGRGAASARQRRGAWCSAQTSALVASGKLTQTNFSTQKFIVAAAHCRKLRPAALACMRTSCGAAAATRLKTWASCVPKVLL
mmetsp:Transcript_23080/g.72639  ORF Transcript_23080/g.72639 Transcript_23080/m.72639 type:complete len:204 (-) Transcript_23080:417-1028(-)